MFNDTQFILRFLQDRNSIETCGNKGYFISNDKVITSMQGRFEVFWLFMKQETNIVMKFGLIRKTKIFKKIWLPVPLSQLAYIRVQSLFHK